MMFQNRKIRITSALYERLQTAASDAGYATTDEFILHTLEQAADGIQTASNKEIADKDILDQQNTDQKIIDQKIIDQQLRGLGYLE